MRIEDLQGPRIKLNAIQETMEILQWLGLDWDGEVLIQSESLHHSEEALDHLIANDAVYHCNLSRKEIQESTSAPHPVGVQKQQVIRPNHVQSHNLNVHTSDTNWRFIVKETHRTIQDQHCGTVELTLDQDFIVWTKQGMPSYQLAVVVDDHRQGVTDVIRGNDLLQSAAWQELLYSAMDWIPPTWHHLPLILGPDGRRLAKRHGETRLTSFRKHGTSPERIIALIARWCSIELDGTEMSAKTFMQKFDPTKLQTDDIVFRDEDKKWLLD